MKDCELKKLIIVGTGPFAEIAKLYFELYGGYRVSAFAVEAKFFDKTDFCNLPVVKFEKVETIYDPDDFEIFVAITYIHLNRTRTRLLLECKRKGFKLASFISPYAFVGPETEMGEHCFIFENNVIQPFAKIGSNVILWSGNHIGHHSTILSNCFISSHVVISGFCKIGENSFIGVNSTIANNVSIGNDNWISPNVTILKNTDDGALYRAQEGQLAKFSALKFFKVSI